MKQFVLKIFIFLVPVIFVSAMVEVLLRKMPNDYREKSQALKQGEDIEVLCLGSSHALYSINPEFLDYDAYNAAFVAQSVDIDNALLQHYINDLPKLKVVMLPVTYITLALRLEDGPEVWRMKNYTLYYDHVFSSHSLDRNSELFGSPFQSIYYRLKDYYIFGRSPLTCSRLGFGTNYTYAERKDLVATGKLAAERHTVKNKKEDYQSNMKSIESIVAVCKSRNIKVVLFTTPASRAYKTHLDNAQLDFTLKFANKLAQEQPEEVYYYDLLSDPDFADSDYYDGDHLNDRGARKMTLKINAFLSAKFGSILSSKK